MEPQGKVWLGNSGRKYAITSPKMRATLAPFDKVGGFHADMATYPYTLFRFPLRSCPSGLSERCYNIDMLIELLGALKDEAQFLLIFLRCVVAVCVVEISEAGEQRTLFEVSINTSDCDRVSEKRQSFLQELRSSNLKLRKSSYRILYEANFHITVKDDETGEVLEKHWLVTTTVGSDEGQDLQAANKLKVLPWVGCALELDNFEQLFDKSGGRIFCFLPLPDEARSPLPLHVNGTFGLSDNRRSIKWPSKERKHDSTADWNVTIVESLLPHCYALLIKSAIKEGLPPHYVYASWPQCDKLKHTPWSGLMKPLFEILFQSDMLWSELSAGGSKGKWISLKDATITSYDEVSDIVHEVLSACGLQLVDYSKHTNIQEAVRFSNKKVTELSPSLARQSIRSKKAVKYQDLPPTTKHELLYYCLLDGKFNELEGLQLLPVSDGSFVTFSPASSGTVCYVCNERHPSSLLPGLKHKLVDMSSQNLNLHRELLKVASTNKTQLQKLIPEVVAHLLPECVPLEWNKKMFAPVAGSVFASNWFETFWRWVSQHNLDLFKDKMVLPVVKHVSMNSELCVARLRSKSCIIYVSENSILDTNINLRKGLEKLDLYFTGTLDNLFPYLQHCRSLKEYVYTTSPSSILSALTNAYSNDEQLESLRTVKITDVEATAIQNFLTDSHTRNTILIYLPIFVSENCRDLHSIASAAEESWGGKAVMITTESSSRFESSSDILPPNIVILCNNQKRLVAPYVDMVDCLHWVDFVLKYLFPMILADSYNPHSKVELLMEELLEQLVNPKFYRRASLVEKIHKIPFLKNHKGKLAPPCKLFDPSKPHLLDMLPPEMFPKEPFNKPSLLHQLRECGLRQAVTAQEILKMIQSINSKKAEAVDVCRAKAVFKYFDSNQNLLDTMVKFDSSDMPLRKALYDVSKQRKWLPQLANPPDYYPSCLGWRGKSLPSLVSLGPETLVCSPNNVKRDCFKVGSAVCIVPCPASLCAVLRPTLNVKMVIKHLHEVIKCYKELGSEMDTIMEHIYEYFLKKTESYAELRDSLPQKFIWMKKVSKFLSTKSLCLKRTPNLPQDLEPYMYVLPDSLQRFSDLFRAMGVKDSITNSQLLNVLASIKKKSDHSHTLNHEEAWMTVMAILLALTLHGKQPVRLKSKEILYVPTNSETLHLEDSSKVCYADCDFLQDFTSLKEEMSEDEDVCVLCHESVRHIAPQLHLTPLSEHYELSEDLFEDFGPHEPLVLRLKNILRDYTDGITIVKELLQNADDAGATEVNLCYDARQHDVNPKTLLYSGMSECNGPALVVHNNAVFTDDDFQNITRLAAATKKDKPLKIGKFGVGFSSVYHITDIPSFVSREYLYIFDPTLQYLKKYISDKSRPGKRLNFTKKIATYSNQLLPFIGLNSFQPKSAFKGTMFRFPFRTAGSEISPIQYTDHHIDQLRKDIGECGSKLLLFLQSVKRLTFSRICVGDKSPHLLLDINKNVTTSTVLSDAQMLHIIYSTSSSEYTEESVCSHWLVGTHSEKIDFGGQDRDATSSVACCLSPLLETSDSEQYCVQSIHGEVFCFLPLSLLSGLPVHVSANFAVQNDRTGIRTSADDGRSANEAEWNVDLMKSTIPKAYLNLLLCLSMMHTDKTITEDYKCYSLLPRKNLISVHNPWDFLLPPLYSNALENRLIYSQSTKSWLKLSESMFLSPDIFSISEGGAQCVQDCVRLLQLPVADLPLEYEHHLPQHNSLNELDFVKLFFDRVDELKCHCKTRNDTIMNILLSYCHAQWNKKLSLKEILQSTKCIPCSPNGEQLQCCRDIIDQKAFFADLYEPNEGVFAIEEFQKYPTNQVLIDLGMVSEMLHASKVADRTHTVQALYLSDQYLALKRAKVILKCIPHVLTDYQHNMEQIKTTQFVPVMQRPQIYPEFLSWAGDHHTLLAPTELYCGDICGCLAGSQVCIACMAEPEQGGCGSIEQGVINRLGMRTTPKFQEVVKHFQHIIEVVTSQQDTHNCNNWLTRTCAEIYQFLEECLKQNPRLDISELECCVWTGSCFVSPNVVASTWVQNGPYLFPVPSNLANNRYLIATLEIQDTFSAETLVNTLQKMKNDYSCTTVDKRNQDFVLFLVTLLGQSTEFDLKCRSCYLPDSNFVLQMANDLTFQDAEWCNSDECSTNYVHPAISAGVAEKLGVKSIRAKLFDEYEGDEFGQSEELTQRIRNILEDYPLDITILKELLQNADDAKATKMVIILDKRTHGMDRLPSDEWKDLQGPALLVWNDSTFHDEDLLGIQKLGLGSKRSKWETIGMYGIGFNVVYHLTDCPSFISTESGGSSTLCVFDPHRRYIPGARKQKPGRKFKNLHQTFWRQWSDIGPAYLRGNMAFSEQVESGSLFRFPLRHNQDLVTKSELVVGSQEPMEAEELEKHLMEWAPHMREALLFLNSVTELKFFVINDNNKVTETHHYKVKIDEDGQCCRTRMQSRVYAFCAANPTPHMETYTLNLTERVCGQCIAENKKWIIQQGVGDMQNPKQNWHYLLQMKPKHGIAAPLYPSSRAEMHVFCFLPLPMNSHLPVHINGSFILHSSRRQLWQPSTSVIDDKTRWNIYLMEAIASSYACLLANHQHIFLPVKPTHNYEATVKSIDQYYKTFPVWLPQCGRVPEGECLSMAKMVYSKLEKMNAPILVHFEEKNEVNFLPLTDDENPVHQAYFCDQETQGLNIILNNIGMRLTEAPILVYEHFLNQQIGLCRVTKRAVFQYYSRFSSQVFSSGSLKPEHINDTKFGSVENFKVFTKYIMTQNESFCFEFPTSPFNLPLLLTADEYLRCFHKRSKAIRTEFSELFSGSKDRFLHPEMMDVVYDKDYFLKPKSEYWEIVCGIMSSKLPSELQCEVISQECQCLTRHTLMEIWKCLSRDEFFHVHMKTIIETWAIIPSSANELFSLKSAFLPIMNDASLKNSAHNCPTMIDIFDILGTLKMPVIDHNVVQKEIAKNFCPNISDTSAIIQNLFYLQKKRNVLNSLSESVVKSLLQYISTIHFGIDKRSLASVKALPLFRRIDGTLCSIENGAFIWPENTCDEGKELWIHQAGHVFLDSEGEWTCLSMSSSLLHIDKISQFKLYSKFIFPVFHQLAQQQRLRHLELIKVSLYHIAESNCQYKALNSKDEREFIECLKILSFIPRSDGALRPVREFADPRNTCFKTFDKHFQFPPTAMCSDEWLDFLVKIGLRKDVETKEYLQFCYEVKVGNHSDLKAASHSLIDYLFQKKDWHNDKYFLSNVSKIPFVVAESLPAVSWIHECAPAEVVVQQGTHTFHLTSLCKAADYEHHKLIWTVKPVVRLPSYPELSPDIAKRKRKDLLSHLKVSKITATEVIQHIQKIAATKLSDIENFETYFCHKPVKDECSLLEVMSAILKYMNDYCQDSHLISQLKDVSCVPVCADGAIEEVRHPVLVKPIQVIASANVNICEFMPFLTRLPHEFYSILPGFLANIGVEQAIMLKHIKGALETIRTLCIDYELDINSREVVKRFIRKLYELLHNQQNPSESDSLCNGVLYLPNSEMILADSKLLLYQDCEHFRKTTLTFQSSRYSELSLLVPRRKISSYYRFNERELCNLLPMQIAPKPLTRSCKEVISRNCKRETTLSPLAKGIFKAMGLPHLASGACAILKHNSNPPEVCEKLEASLEQVFKNTEVITVRHLTVDLWLELSKPAEHIGTAEVDFHFEKRTKATFCLYVDKDARKIFFFENLAIAILSLAAEMCGVSIKNIKEPQFALIYLLKAETSDNIASTLRELGVSTLPTFEGGDSREETFNPFVNHVLGEPLPESWHHRLQQDYNNLFRPGEWVGYELEDDCIVFAIIGYKVDETDGDFARYCIYVEEGEGDGVKVSVLDIYKIRRSTVGKGQTASSELKVYEGNGEEPREGIQSSEESIPQSLTEMKREICEELKKIWKLPNEDMRRRAIKRMYLKWHPDKNLDNVELAGEAFKFLKRQLERLECGKPMESPDVSEEDPEEKESRPHTSPFWESFFRTWDSRAHNHSHYEQSEWRWSSAGPSDSHTFTSSFPDSPKPDIDKARKWFRQAECDYKALSILSDCGCREVCANICFLAHEVTEKSLKAGMLAVWGLRLNEFTHHKKMTDFAINLEQNCPGLLIHVLNLPTERFYYRTRWPNKHGIEHGVPADYFDESSAEQANNNAKAVLDKIRAVVV